MHCTSVMWSSKFFHFLRVCKTRMLVVCDQPDLMLLFSLAAAHLMVFIVMDDWPECISSSVVRLWNARFVVATAYIH